MQGFRFELPEDTQRKLDLSGEVLKLKRLIDEREKEKILDSVTNDLKRRYEILRQRLEAWK